ncbi:hypothetical protein A2973_01690 [Candidatus Gottesmanbacteria bacterium RIFCSPLOWO2_01_FULL_49_10]|uniref:Uncharacterized protein n=1 Tax=Candidatus Gottesmanbacteria bacterium RIFCSPLOWO2_01_FULL_49_10 TaxID=1798396 RepID=A0A1F6AWG1_9BACT|nr:MAG: hypothetical protein A2973_01690 [Candidatus Gottesmanbacteria bacterium RIFCSPLOWO2_01_FULL_49_10]
MDETLRSVIARVEQSDLSLEEKEELYTAISEGLHAVVLPVLLKSMPQDRVEALSKNPDQITLDTYITLVQEALKNDAVGKEVPDAMGKLLVEVNRLLAKEGIQ